MKHLESLFEEVYQLNYQKVYRLCMGYANGDAMLANDLCQEVFIKVWESLASFRNEATMSTWIYRITVNTCLLYFRKKKTLPISKLTEPIEEETEENSHQIKEDNLNSLYACIDKLSKDNKSIILLELEGIPQKEIANIMGINHEAIRVRIHRIKTELTKCVQK
jgi:RNA polymerase sigma-70 factor (ECF subfamily)